MKASQIRNNGIVAPGNTYVGGDAQNDTLATINNLAILCGVGLEIAAQLAEANQVKLIQFESGSGNTGIWINPLRIIAVTARLTKDGGTYIFVGGGEEDHFVVSDPLEEVLKKLRE